MPATSKSAFFASFRYPSDIVTASCSTAPEPRCPSSFAAFPLVWSLNGRQRLQQRPEASKEYLWCFQRRQTEPANTLQLPGPRQDDVSMEQLLTDGVGRIRARSTNRLAFPLSPIDRLDTTRRRKTSQADRAFLTTLFLESAHVRNSAPCWINHLVQCAMGMPSRSLLRFGHLLRALSTIPIHPERPSSACC